MCKKDQIVKIIMVVMTAMAILAGCNPSAKKDSPRELGVTIGEMVNVTLPESITIDGYSLVGGLRKTGSSQCPVAIRNYLTRYIVAKAQRFGVGSSNAEGLINSLDTAVVLVEAVMPVATATSNYFDVKVTALPSTQTSSLDFGWLYGTEMQVKGTFGFKMEILGDAEGPLFFDKISSSDYDKKTGYILAGGKNLGTYKIVLTLKKSDFLNAYNIRNRINERYGKDIANASSANRIEISIPEKYNFKRQKFISLIKAIYLTETSELNAQRAKFYSKRLLESQNRQDSEIALEAIGLASIAELKPLIDSNDQDVALRAARCMLNLRDNTGLSKLKQIAQDEKSACRVEALEAIAFGGTKNDTITISRLVLRDKSFDVKLAAYEQMRELSDSIITREIVGKNFYIEEVMQPGKKIIYVTRSGQPRIVLFGDRIFCNNDIFIESADGEITVTASSPQNYITIIRKNPKKANTVPRLRCTLLLSDFIKTLCDDPVEGDQGIGGLGLPYADAIALLKQMCDKGVIDAQFVAGPLPKIDINVKK
jgi:flagellar basal body P-ring protein FlgI